MKGYPLLPENDLRVFELALVAVRVPHTQSLHVRLVVSSGDRFSYVARRWECPSGAPSPSQLEDMLAVLAAETNTTVVTVTGVQGILT